MLNKKAFILLFIIIVSLFNFSFFISSVNAHNPTWWNYDWKQRLEFTVNSTLVDSNLTNFPILIYLDENIVNWGDIQNNLDDIRFIDDYLNELNYEIDDLVLNFEAWFHVALNCSASVDTYFFMYYDNKFCDSGENAEAVWDTDFVMVQHMNDATTSTILDSTSNDNDGTKKAANEPIETTGKIGKAQDFAGDDDYINCGDSIDLKFDTSDFSVSVWFKTSSIAHQIIIGNQASGQKGYAVYLHPTNQYVYVSIKGVDATVALHSSVALNDGVDHLVTLTVDRSGNALLYIDGEYITAVDVSGVGSIISAFDLYIGATVNLPVFDGVIDEPQISDGVWSSAWVGASYYSGTLELVIVGYHEHASDISLIEDINDNTLIIIIVLVVACSAFLVTITHERGK